VVEEVAPLSQAQEAGIVPARHQTANLIVGRGDLKILDFGIAKLST